MRGKHVASRHRVSRFFAGIVYGARVIAGLIAVMSAFVVWFAFVLMVFGVLAYFTAKSLTN